MVESNLVAHSPETSDVMSEIYIKILQQIFIKSTTEILIMFCPE